MKKLSSTQHSCTRSDLHHQHPFHTGAMIKDVIIKYLSGIACLLVVVSHLPAYSQNRQPEQNSQNNARTVATTDFKGVNWADIFDNFKDDQLVIGGLALTDDYSTVRAKAGTILTGFQNVGINTIRIPINYPTVSTPWWNAYSGVIDEASSRGMKIIIAYWEAKSSQDGQVDNLLQFWNMWQTVTSKYVGDNNVYFEVMNEPAGYTAANLNSLYAFWLSFYPSVPRNRILLGGVGYSENVNPVGADSRFSQCLLSYHNYTWFKTWDTSSDWESGIYAINYPERTIMTEFGMNLTTGKDFINAPDVDREIAYFQGLTDALRERGMGAVYWPGLRIDDTYSLFRLDGNNLTVTNNSGLARLRSAWNYAFEPLPLAKLTENAAYTIVCRQSGKNLDVNGASINDGAKIIQWQSNGGANQQWQFSSLGNGYFTIINANSTKAIGVENASAAPAAQIVQSSYTGAESQQWSIRDAGFGYYQIRNRNTGQSLDVNGGSVSDGADIIQWLWSGARNQQWKISKVSNIAPQLSTVSKDGEEGQVVGFTTPDFTSHFTDVDTDVLNYIKITSLPANGTLWLDGIYPVTVGQQIMVESIARLSFKPNQNWTGTTVFGWNGSDGTVYAPADGLVVISVAPLPVTLVSFVAKAEGARSVLLSWSTAQESNASHFEIQHSVDTKKWQQVGSIAATGESNQIRNYFFTHTDPKEGLNYYRLKMVDLDQSWANSTIRKIEIKPIPSAPLFYPNPATDQITLGMDRSEIESVLIYSITGRLAAQIRGKIPQQIKVDHLPAGMYVVNLRTKTGQIRKGSLVVSGK